MELEKFYFYAINDKEENSIDFISKKDLENDSEKTKNKFLENAIPLSKLKDWYKDNTNKFVYQYQLDEMNENDKNELVKIFNDLNIKIRN